MLGRDVARQGGEANEAGNRGNVHDRSASVPAFIGITIVNSPPLELNSRASQLLTLHNLQLLADAEEDAPLVHADDLVPVGSGHVGSVPKSASDARTVDGVVEAPELVSAV